MTVGAALLRIIVGVLLSAYVSSLLGAIVIVIGVCGLILALLD